MQIPNLLPLLPIRNAVVLPGASMPLIIGRDRSVTALKYALQTDRYIVVATQKNLNASEPKEDEIYRTGTICKIENAIETDANSYQIMIAGISRYEIAEFIFEDNMIKVRGETVADIIPNDEPRMQALINALKQLSKEILALIPGPGDALSKLIDKIEDPSQLANLCATYLNLNIPIKQKLLEEKNLDKRIEMLLNFMNKEKEVLTIQKSINDKLNEKMTKAHREAILREQLRTIKEELGEESFSNTKELEKKLKEAKLPPEAQKIANEELQRLEMLPPASSEYHVVRSYLDWLASLPWKKSTQSNIDLEKAKKILDEEHYGLEKVKKRILQFLAVAKLKNNLSGPILCLVGPPGVGKTSLGQSIAKAIGRKFVRASLGGIRDESEIRGHRRTYIGAMPGRIIQSLKRVGVNNPVLLLDEIDKLGVSFQGDPAAALLEVLDPEQNSTFVDHYIDTAFDLSNVFFIATANNLEQIPAPLRDRMEIIQLSSYTTYEKKHIAKNYLVPNQLKNHGLDSTQVEFTEDAIDTIINHYTREAGVRELNRKIGACCLAAAEIIVSKKDSLNEKLIIDSNKVKEFLGNELYHPEKSETLKRPGIVTGLAWTPVGGDILTIEASSMPGSGKLILTGQLGDVMKESAQIAMSLIRSMATTLNPTLNFDKQDFHIHVPAGAIPKDGPSAGITIATALASLITDKIVDSKTAMTGEITLRGAVTPVGGIKEKVLAAHRAGIKRIFMSKKNEPDLKDIPEEVKQDIQFILVENLEEVLSQTLNLPIETFKLNPLLLTASQVNLSGQEQKIVN
jgi:ATP-dependent Lon protease